MFPEKCMNSLTLGNGDVATILAYSAFVQGIYLKLIVLQCQGHIRCD